MDILKIYFYNLHNSSLNRDYKILVVTIYASWTKLLLHKIEISDGDVSGSCPQLVPGYTVGGGLLDVHGLWVVLSRIKSKLYFNLRWSTVYVYIYLLHCSRQRIKLTENDFINQCWVQQNWHQYNMTWYNTFSNIQIYFYFYFENYFP